MLSIVSYLFLTALPAATPELRGVWLTTTANAALSSPKAVADTMRRLKKIGINTVYVEVWKNGYTQYPSDVLKREIGFDRHPALDGQRDLLAETLREAHRNGLVCVAWFEYGFMAAHEGTGNELLERRRSWMTETADGKLISKQNPFVWMNPSRPECQDFLLGLIKEVASKYPVDGIQLDDRIAWPTSMGYDSYTLAKYATEHNGNRPPSDSKEAGWVQWRAQKVTGFAERLNRELKELRPSLIVSISPAVFPWSLDNYACDWPHWLKQGWMTEFVPQVYRRSAAEFARDWNSQRALFANPGARLAAGVMLDSAEGTVAWDDLKTNLELLASTQSGHVFWYSRSLLGTHAPALEDYYRRRGPAFNPHRIRKMGTGTVAQIGPAERRLRG